MSKRRFVIFMLVLAWFDRDGARAQTNVDLRKTLCPGVENAFVVLSPVPVASGGTVNVPVCAVIGAGLRFTTNAQGLLTLEAVSTGTAPQAPRLVTETFPVQAGIPAAQETLSILLQRTPVAGSDVLVFFRGSRMGADTVVGATPSGTNMRSFIVRLPSYRPFAGDAFLFVYMTTEP